MKKFLALAIAFGLTSPAFSADKPKPTPEDQFKKMDKDGNGKISFDEFKGKREGDKLAAAEKQFKAKDKNSDGSLDLEEFKAGGKKAK